MIQHEREELMDLPASEVEAIAEGYGLLDELEDDDDIPNQHHLVGMILDHENELASELSEEQDRLQSQQRVDEYHQSRLGKDGSDD